MVEGGEGLGCAAPTARHAAHTLTQALQALPVGRMRLLVHDPAHVLLHGRVGGVAGLALPHHQAAFLGGHRQHWLLGDGIEAGGLAAAARAPPA